MRRFKVRAWVSLEEVMSTEPVTVTTPVTPMAYFAQGEHLMRHRNLREPSRPTALTGAISSSGARSISKKALPASPEAVVVYVAALAGPSDVSRHRRMQEGSS